MSPYTRMPVLQLGLRRADTSSGKPLLVDARHRPDAFRILDASAAPTAGTRWGIRTHNDSVVCFQGNPMQFGILGGPNSYGFDYWTSLRQLTIDWCHVAPAEGFKPWSPLFGLGQYFYDTSPWRLCVGETPDRIQLSLRTTDLAADGPNPGDHNFWFSAPGPGPHRYAWQVDLAAGTVHAYVDGKEVEVHSTTHSTPLKPSAGLKRNERYPFLIGFDGKRPPMLAAQSGQDLTLFGLHIHRGLRYQQNGPGTPQKFVDAGLTLNDLNRYFTPVPGTICLLPMQDNPASGTRLVTVQNGKVAGIDFQGAGVFVLSALSGGIKGNSVRHLKIVCSNGGGPGICYGSVFALDIEDCTISGGVQVIATSPCLGGYTVRIRNCRLQGDDVCFDGHYGRVVGEHLDLNSGLSGVVRTRGMNSHWSDIDVNPMHRVERLFGFLGDEYGGQHTLEKAVLDVEGQAVDQAQVYCEVHPGMSTTLGLRDISFGSPGSGALIMLRDGAPQGGEWQPALIHTENLRDPGDGVPGRV
jgi:hypothetical protein